MEGTILQNNLVTIKKKQILIVLGIQTNTNKYEIQ